MGLGGWVLVLAPCGFLDERAKLVRVLFDLRWCDGLWRGGRCGPLLIALYGGCEDRESVYDGRGVEIQTPSLVLWDEMWVSGGVGMGGLG